MKRFPRTFIQFKSVASRNWRLAACGLAGALVLAGGCSHGAHEGAADHSPITPPPEVPGLAGVAQPVGYDLADLRLIFVDKSAPPADSLKECDRDFQALRQQTDSKDELFEGARELVRQEPVAYHWCFYGKILELENYLRGESFIEERQKKTVETYAFLAPIARSFLYDFHDSRYLRWTIYRYRQISEQVFFRKLDVTPEMTAELVQASNPFDAAKDPTATLAGAPPAVQYPVLAKHNLLKEPTAALSSVTAPVAQASPEVQASPLAQASPVAQASPEAQASPVVQASPVAQAAPPSPAPSPQASAPETTRVPASEDLPPLPSEGPPL